MAPSSLPTFDRPEKKRSYHHGDLRKSIIGAVAQLIGDSRSLDFKLRDVAELVGTSQPAIYKHFDNRAALLVETAIEGYALQRRFRERAFELCDRSPLQQALALAHAYVYFARTHPGFFTLMKNLETKEILDSRRYAYERDMAVALAAQLIDGCIADGLFQDVETQLALILLQSAATGLAHMYLTDTLGHIAPGHVDDPELTGEIIELSMSGLLTPKGRRALKSMPKDPFAALDEPPDRSGGGPNR